MLTIWLVLFLVFTLVEATTTTLVTIWFAIGALVALVVLLIGFPVWAQVVVFFVVSISMLVAFLPLVRKKLSVGKAKTNAEDLIGRKVVVKEEIKFNKYGTVSINGVIWAASSDEEIQEEAVVKIVAINGNKVIVKKV